MNTGILVLVAGVFTISSIVAMFLIDHPLFAARGALTKEDMLRGQAVIHFCGDRIKIDGETPAREDQVMAPNRMRSIQVYPGTHRIDTVFTVPGGKHLGTKREHLSFEITLEQGQEYELKIGQRAQSSEAVVLLIPLKTVHKKEYLICEKMA